MERIGRIVGLVFIGSTLMWLSGCAKYVSVPVPPRVGLHDYGTIGLIGFTSNPDPELGDAATQQFVQELQSAQPGVAIVELGAQQWVLGSVHQRYLDREAILEIGREHGVDAIMTGQLDFKRVRPEVSFSSVIERGSARVDKEATISAKLVETGGGATLWTGSSQATTTVANADFNSAGRGGFRLGSSKAADLELMRAVVYEVTNDFRGHYVRKRVED